MRQRGSALPIALLAVVSMISLASCGGSDDSSPGAADASTTTRPLHATSFTDDRGNTIELPDGPLRVAAQSVSAGGLWEFGIKPVAVWGPAKRADGAKSPAIGEADPDSWESVGDELGAINLEALAAARPDVIVTAWWGDDNGLWGIDKEQESEVAAIAPIVGVGVANQSLPESLQGYADLAEALGADMKSQPVVAARQRFDDAADELRDAAAAAPDLKVGGVSGDAGHVYIAVPKAWSDLRFYESLGVNLVTPTEHDEFWETLSWEESTKYPVDLVLADNRGGDVKAILKSYPAAQRLVPAIGQGQIALWQMETAFGYSNFAKVMHDLAKEIRGAKVITE
jgi:iron complex transport system substrate-binding protein